MEQGKPRVLTKSKSLDEQIKYFKDDINNKLEHFYQDLDTELRKAHTLPESDEKITEYFKAFIETFSSVYVICQVEESRHVELASESTEGIFLSTLGSLVPFLENAKFSEIKNVRELLDSKEMRIVAKKIKELSRDTTELSQLIGKTALQVALNQDKLQQIVNVTADDLKDASLEVFQKLVRIIENIGEEIDVYLYTKLYRTPSARLGHKDANEVIAEWLNGELDTEHAEAEFVKTAMSTKPEENRKTNRPMVEIEHDKVSNKDCCSMF